jgi:hypothetical protein
MVATLPWTPPVPTRVLETAPDLLLMEGDLGGGAAASCVLVADEGEDEEAR